MTMLYKSAGFESKEVPDGVVIYDSSREKVVFLNYTAAYVLELCDGERDPATIAKLLKDASGLVSAPQKDVEDCLQSLLSEGLVTPIEKAESVGFFASLKRFFSGS